MKVLEAGENYLEAILMEHKKHQFVRSIDLANALGYSKPTISVAMKQFRENGYIEIDESGNITLTEAGNEIAEKMYERHMVIAQFLMSVGVDEKTAYEDSCKIEHDISEKTFQCIKAFYNKSR